MFRGTVIAFIAGWIIWFWIDKNPHSLGHLPPAMEEQFSANFQMAIDLVKAQRYKAAFVYLWKAHYLVLSVAGGVLLAMSGASVSRLLARRRLSRLYIPARKSRSGATGSKAGEGEQPGPESDRGPGQ